MDSFISPADRERGVALARQIEAQARAMPASSSARTATRVGEPPASPAPIRTAALPPSRPAREAEAPAPRAAPEPRQSAGGWRIQLGAFRDRGNAEALWRRLAGRLRNASPSYVAGGGLMRLQAGGYPSKAAAASACAAAKSAGAQCVVVAP
jgi:hypothetical protein